MSCIGSMALVGVLPHFQGNCRSTKVEATVPEIIA